MSDTPIFDRLVEDFRKARNVRYERLLASHPIKAGSLLHKPAVIRGARPCGYFMDEVVYTPKVSLVKNVEDILQRDPRSIVVLQVQD